jgi:two-component sensor histidine kinase
MRKRLFAVAAAALIPALGLLAYNELSLRAVRNAEVHTEAERAAKLAASEIDLVIEGVRSLVIAVSAIPAVNEMTPGACETVVSDVVRPVDSIEAILVLDKTGRVVCSTTGVPPGVMMADRQYFQDALQRDDVAVGGYTEGRLSKTPVLPVARVMKRGGQITGVVVAGIKLDWLQNRLNERGVVPGGAYTIADRDGVIIARNPFPERFVGTVIPEKFKYLVNADHPGTLEILSQDGTERILSYKPVSETSPLYISAGLSREEAFANINRATWASVAIIVLGAILALSAANFVGVHFIIRPIERIVEVIHRWAAGDIAARTRMAGAYGEVGQVGASVDELLDELDRRSQMTRDAETAKELVSRELAHRVKNTMSIIQVIAKQTFKRLGNTAEFATFTERLASLSGAYDILLSSSGHGGNIGDVISKAIGPHNDPERPRFTLRGSEEIQLPPDAALALTMVVHELATNAAKYGALRHDDGQIDIEWQVDANKVAMSWSERDGPPVERPSGEGFGSILIKRAFTQGYHPRTRSVFEPDGLKFHLDFELSKLNIAVKEPI